jgi:hypothetical protein
MVAKNLQPGTVPNLVRDIMQFRFPLFTAANDFIISTGAGIGAKKTLAETKTILGMDISCRAYNSAVETIGNASVTLITFDSESWDTDTMHDTSTNPGRITCKIAGKYIVTATVGWAVGGGALRMIQLKKNASVMSENRMPNIVSNYVYNNIAMILDLAINDYITVSGYQDSGGDLDTLSGVANLNFAAARIC